MPSFLRSMAIVAPIVTIAAGVSGLVVWSRQSDRFPLRTVEVQLDLQKIRGSEITSTVTPFLPAGFFGINVRSVQENVQRLPWAQSVEVKRVWPDRLLILVQEKRAQARWGKNGLLSTEGAIFYPELDSIPDNLPQFIGPADRSKEMVQQYLTLLEMLAPIGLTVKQLTVSDEGSWRMVLDNGLTIIIGKAGVHERIARFVLAYPENLQSQVQQLEYVDLRYTNGFAVGWKASER